MKPVTTILALALAAVLAAGAARADDDCHVPMADWQLREAVAQLAAHDGWNVRHIRIEDGCCEIDGRVAAGRPCRLGRMAGSGNLCTLGGLGIAFGAAAVVVMAEALILAARPRLPEPLFGGLDRMQARTNGWASRRSC